MRNCLVIISILAAHLSVAGGSLADKRRAVLDRYLQRLSLGVRYDAQQENALADLPFDELRRVIRAYVNARDVTDPYGFQQLLLRNSKQYVLPKELLDLYARDYLKWLEADGKDRRDFFDILAASKMRRSAADLAVRLTPQESLVYIEKSAVGDEFRSDLLNAWSRRLSTRKEDRAFDSSSIRSVLMLTDQSQQYLEFQGYWPKAKDVFRKTLVGLLQSKVREDVMKALLVQETHPAACDLNEGVVDRWRSDSEIVIQALKNIGEDTARDHSKMLRQIWSRLPDDGKQRYWCLYSIAVHPKGNQEIALKSIKRDGYDSLDLTLNILRHDANALKQGIALMLKTHNKGHSELFRFASTYQIPGFQEDALAALKKSSEHVSQMNALAYLGSSAGAVRVKLLDYLGHKNPDIRLSAINAFADVSGLTKTHRDEIAPLLIKVYQADASYGNRQQALYVLGRWKATESRDVFRKLLDTIDVSDYKGDGYWVYRMRLMCWLGLARLEEQDALERLARIHRNGTDLQRMDILLAYMDLELCPDAAFEDLNQAQPRLAGTAAELIRRYGSEDQKTRLKTMQAAPLWKMLPKTGLDEYHVVEHRTSKDWDR